MICLYVKIVNRDSYNSNGSVNVTTLQVETSTKKETFQALASLLLSSLQEAFSEIVFFASFLRFFRPLYSVLLSINDTVVSSNKLLIL